MRLPIKAVVEEIDAVQIVAAGAPVFRIRRLRYSELCSVAVSAGIASDAACRPERKRRGNGRSGKNRSGRVVRS
jgi:hypothetical protein